MTSSTLVDKPEYEIPTAVRVKMINYLAESIVSICRRSFYSVEKTNYMSLLENLLLCWGDPGIDICQIFESFLAKDPGDFCGIGNTFQKIAKPEFAERMAMMILSKVLELSNKDGGKEEERSRSWI
jgi:hypothetical protein